MASMGRIVTVAFVLLFSALQARAAVVVRNLQVEYRSHAARD